MKNQLIFGFIITCIWFLSACKKDEKNSNLIEDSSLAYFPIDSGLTRYYQIDSVYWDEFAHIRDTINYQLKEVIAGSFIDLEGRKVQRIERFKLNLQGQWIIFSVGTSYRNHQKAESVENNVRILKLVFPATLGISWNGNIYNFKNPQCFEYLSVGVPDTTEFYQLHETIKVQEDNEPSNNISDLYGEERYAKNIGMYYRIISDLKFQPSVPPNKDTIAGYIYTEKLTAYTP
ncbi:MAG: hypothetical protein IPO63_12105 [Bacteroidetes bacterium]|nr:hypothetical protein [Bacteroidota bacterium]